MDEGLLDRVLGEVAVPKDQSSERVEAVERVRHQHIERIAIAVRCALNELIDLQVKAPVRPVCKRDAPRRARSSILAGGVEF